MIFTGIVATVAFMTAATAPFHPSRHSALDARDAGVASRDVHMRRTVVEEDSLASRGIYARAGKPQAAKPPPQPPAKVPSSAAKPSTSKGNPPLYVPPADCYMCYLVLMSCHKSSQQGSSKA